REMASFCFSSQLNTKGMSVKLRYSTVSLYSTTERSFPFFFIQSSYVYFTLLSLLPSLVFHPAAGPLFQIPDWLRLSAAVPACPSVTGPGFHLYEGPKHGFVLG